MATRAKVEDIVSAALLGKRAYGIMSNFRAEWLHIVNNTKGMVVVEHCGKLFDDLSQAYEGWADASTCARVDDNLRSQQLGGPFII